MNWRDGHFRPKQKVQFTFNAGGIGDYIAAMTAIKYVRDNFKFVDIHLFCPDFFVELAQNLVPKITVVPYSKLNEYWDENCPAKQIKNEHTSLATHLVDHAFHVLVNKEVKAEHKNYCRLDTKNVNLSKFNLPERYVVVTTGFTATVREMVPETVNGIVDWLLSKNITPVFLGNKQAPVGVRNEKLIGNFKDTINFSKGINLIDQTSLVEAGAVIAGAQAIVGLDNGLLHLAGTTSVPIIFGTTTVEAYHRLPYRDNVLGKDCYVVEPTKSLKCRFCQTNWNFNYAEKIDFKLCFYKDYKCTKELTADKYIKFLELILK